VRTEYAEEVYRVSPMPSGKGVNLLCPTRKIRSRGDTLNLSTLSIVRCGQAREPPFALVAKA
jgi:alpha-D-xyloside xylohydrolase